MKLEGRKWRMASLFFANNAVLLDESEEQLQRLVSEFNSVYKRENIMKVTVMKSKLIQPQTAEYV